MPKFSLMSFQSFDWNVTPLSQVTVVGSPKCRIQPSSNAIAHWAAVASDMGIASRNLLVRQITVNKYFLPSELGKGPQTSTMTSENLFGSTGLESILGVIVRFFLAWLQGTHFVTNSEMYALMSGQ